MNNELSGFMKEVTKQILELKKKIDFLEEEGIRNALRIHELQKHTGTHPDIDLDVSAEHQMKKEREKKW